MKRLINAWRVVGWLALAMIAPAHAQNPDPSAGSRDAHARWTEVLRPIMHRRLQVSDQSGLSVGILELRGRVLESGIDVGTLSAWVTYRLREKIIRYDGYVRYRYARGSFMLASLSVKGPVPGMQQGTLTVIDGTGRFERIEPTVSLTTWTTNPAEGINRAKAVGRFSPAQP